MPLIKEHKIERHYLALVNGIVKHDRGKIELPIARSPFNRKQMAVLEEGKAAITHFTVKERFLTNTLIECVLETGRTHQIRVHMKYFKHPITGDLQYGPKNKQDKVFGQFLHAYKLIFTHPLTGEKIELEAKLPKIFKDKLKVLREDLLEK